MTAVDDIRALAGKVMQQAEDAAPSSPLAQDAATLRDAITNNLARCPWCNVVL